MRLTKCFITLILTSLVLGQLGRLPFPSSGLYNIYLQDILVLALAFFGFLSFLLRRQPSFRIDLSAIAGLVFLIWALITFVFHTQWQGWSENLLGFSYWLRFSLYFSVYLIFCQLSWQADEEFRRWFLKALVLSGVALAFTGFIQLWQLPDLSVIADLGYDPHRNRLVSTFLDPNFTGAFLVLALNLLFSAGLFPAPVAAAISGFLIVAIILTFSRSTWLMLAVSVFFFGWFRSRRLLGLAFLIGFLAYFLVPRVQTRLAGVADPDDSARLRFVSWRRTIQVSADNLLLGVGFNNFRTVQADYGFFDFNLPEGGRAGAGSDSSLLLVLVTTGVIGLIVYLFFYFSLILALGQSYFRGDLPSLGLLVSLFGLLIESNFVNSLFFTPILFVVLAAAGVLLGKKEFLKDS